MHTGNRTAGDYIVFCAWLRDNGYIVKRSFQIAFLQLENSYYLVEQN